MRKICSFLLLGFSVFSFAGLAAGPRKYNTTLSSERLGESSWFKYKNVDGDEFFMQPGADAKLPVVITVQGSGCDSIFHRKADGKILTTGLHGYFPHFVKGKAHVLVVEKPGVPLYLNYQEGATENCPTAYLKEFDFNSWLKKLNRVIRDLHKLPQVDYRKIVIVGHSEGGQVASHLAAQLSAVTDVVALSSSNQSQLGDFISAAKAAGEAKKTEEQVVSETLKRWAAVLENPKVVDSFIAGHNFKYWATKFATRPVDSLKKTKARIFLAHGTSDKSVPIETFDATLAELTASKVKFDYLRVSGGSHSFDKDADPKFDGFEYITKEVVDWLKL